MTDYTKLAADELAAKVELATAKDFMFADETQEFRAALSELVRRAGALLACDRERQEAESDKRVLRENLRVYAETAQRYREALEQIVALEARSEYESIYSCPSEFAAIARDALAALPTSATPAT